MAAIATDNGRLAIIELDQDYEPGLPLLPGALGQDDLQQLLWGFPEVPWADAAPTVEKAGPGLWAREPGRGRESPDTGRGRFAVDPGRGLEMTRQAEWIGTYTLPTGGTAGGKRRFFVYFGNMEEFLAANVGGLADTLTGTPTVTVTGDGSPLPTIASPAFNTTTATIRLNGQVVTAAAYTVLYFTAVAGSAPAGDYTLHFHADTTAGYVLEPTATLKLE